MRLLLVTLCALAVPSTVRADAAEDAAVEAVKRLGGSVGQNRKVVSLSSTRVTDAELKGLAALTSLTKLDLTDTKVTDAGLKQLAALKGLTGLNLSNTKVTDAGLNELVALKRLTTLTLVTTKVTDAGAKAYERLNPNCYVYR